VPGNLECTAVKVLSRGRAARTIAQVAKELPAAWQSIRMEIPFSSIYISNRGSACYPLTIIMVAAVAITMSARISRAHTGQGM
jgi:hypothetical protein